MQIKLNKLVLVREGGDQQFFFDAQTILLSMVLLVETDGDFF